MNTEKIGKFIATKRKEKNLTQRELATKLRVTDRAVSKWERGLGCPDISLLEDLSEILEISIVDLLNGEIVENSNILEKDLIDSMKYSKNYTKSKINSMVNSIITLIIICICILLVIANVINSYMLNKTYDTISISEKMNDTINNVEKYCDIIINNQGIYTDEDYEILVEYATKIKEVLNDTSKKYLFKEKYKMEDYYEFEEYYEKYLKDMDYDNKAKYSEYFILLKYDTSVVDHMLTYQSQNEYINRMSRSLSSLVDNSYKYTLHLHEIDGMYSPLSIISMMYAKEEMLLFDIIEVGGLQ